MRSLGAKSVRVFPSNLLLLTQGASPCLLPACLPERQPGGHAVKAGSGVKVIHAPLPRGRRACRRGQGYEMQKAGETGRRAVSVLHRPEGHGRVCRPLCCGWSGPPTPVLRPRTPQNPQGKSCALRASQIPLLLAKDGREPQRPRFCVLLVLTSVRFLA